MDLIQIIRNVPFHPGIGDPSPLGWFTVFAYFVAALFCAATALRGTSRTRASRLWWGLALLLLFLGVNKQLDLQSWFTAVGRAVARAQGWYGLRRSVQLWFILAVALSFGGVLLAAAWFLRREMRRTWLALLGMGGLLGFVLVRAASFHHVDLLINRRVLGLRINWILELGAIGLVIAAVVGEWRREPAGSPLLPNEPARLRGPLFLGAFGALIAAVAVGALLLSRGVPENGIVAPPATRVWNGAVPVYTLPTAPETFRETFDGSPDAPTPWHGAGWDLSIFTRNVSSWYDYPEVDAAFGPDCVPDGTHAVTTYAEGVFQCRGRAATAINGVGYGAVVLTPPRLLDFSAGEAVLRFDLSTKRTSNRDWIEIWVSPFEDNLHAPTVNQASGAPRRALRLALNNQEAFSLFRFEAFEVVQSARGWQSWTDVLTPGRDELATFELHLSREAIRFGLPEYDLWWVDAELETPLDWTRGVVQLAQHSFEPAKGCDGCVPNTWVWDNVEMSPALPFTVLPADRRYVDVTTATEVLFEQPAPEDAYLRFSGRGADLEVSFDGGTTWTPAEAQAQRAGMEEFRTFWMEVPAGTFYIRFRGNDAAGAQWHVRDIALWSRQVVQP